MAQLSWLLCALALAASPCAGFFCPPAVNTGSVGSCMFFGCSASRGPTQCEHGACYCQEGYCRYPAGTVHIQSRRCVQRVPDSTCHLSRFCYKAGFFTSFCDSGYCMCKFGYTLDASGKCAKADEASFLVANYTGAEVEDMIEIQRHEDFAVALNLAMFAAWSTAVLAGMVGGAIVIRRKLRGSLKEDNEFTAALLVE
mmetsp:Transcript_87447/g.255722  ORF Transcript_87447/g.255722 Transcript_87447/m.255722 type:complete len:198 (+) Transcript_87447:68-661(+)